MSSSGDAATDLIIKAKQAYINPRGKSLEEFLGDFSRLRYIKRLINRRLKGSAICDRLLLNHIIVWFNVFDTHMGLEIMLSDLDPDSVSILLAYTDYINLSNNKAEAIERCPITVSNLRML